MRAKEQQARCQRGYRGHAIIMEGNARRIKGACSGTRDMQRDMLHARRMHGTLTGACKVVGQRHFLLTPATGNGIRRVRAVGGQWQWGGGRANHSLMLHER